MNRIVNLALLAVALCFPVTGMAQVQTGQGLLCDSAEQVETFAAHVADGADKALTFVNEAAGTTACGIVPVAYIEGAEVKTISAGRIVEILIVGANLGMGWQQVPPMKQFALFPNKGRGV